MSTIRWHLGQMDALRGLAVFGTVAVHAAAGYPVSRFTALALAGQRGVQLFFILSWFTLFLSMEQRRDEAHPLRNFFLRRAFRLVPLYWLMLGVAAFATPVLAGPWRTVALSALFLHGLSPYLATHGAAGGWTLACEAASYCVLPLVHRRVRNLRAAVRLFVGTALVCGGGSWAISLVCPIGAVEYVRFLWFPVELPVFALGIVGNWLWKEHAQAGNRAVSGAVLGLSVGFAMAMLPFSNASLYPTSVLALGLTVALLLHPWPLLVNRATIFLGRISYSVYLLHAYVLHLVVDPALARLSARAPVEMLAFRLVGTLLLTVPLGALTWWLVEETGIRAGRRVIAHLEGRPLRSREAAMVVPAEALLAEGNSPDAQF
jgi:peptidoglycan/LPS O-acetylase OafA/YrhL